MKEDLRRDDLGGHAAVEADDLSFLCRPGGAALLPGAPRQGEAPATAPLKLEEKSARRFGVLDVAAIVGVRPRHQCEVAQVLRGEASL